MRIKICNSLPLHVHGIAMYAKERFLDELKSNNKIKWSGLHFKMNLPLVHTIPFKNYQGWKERDLSLYISEKNGVSKDGIKIRCGILHEFKREWDQFSIIHES